MGHAEHIVEGYLAQQAKKHNILCYKFTSPGTRGVPDRILIGNGQVIFVETKSTTGTLSPLQKTRIADMKEHGACVFTCHSKEEADRIIASLCEKEPGK